MMKYDVIDVIADLVRQSTPDLPARLEYQAEALSELECTQPMLGRWIDEYDVNYLLSAFALADKDFAAKFPGMAHFSGHERQQFLIMLETHFERCPHCSLKRGYELELDARIEQACRQNRDSLLQLLEEETTEMSDEGEHQNDKRLSARAAHQ
jgi:hypothetical protein